MPFENTLDYNPLFSEGANQAIQALAPSGAKTSAAFPNRSGWKGSLRVKDEQLHTWFQRIIGPKEQADERIAQCAIRDDFAFFGQLSWNQNGISYCNLQALLTSNGDLLDYYLDPKEEISVRYYRLDLDIRKPGPLFKETMPHLHCIPDGPPRFSFLCPPGEFLPIVFLEFIYLNHFHEDWLKWVKRVLSKRGGELMFSEIKEAYDRGNLIDLLSELGPDLERLKALLSFTKRSSVMNPPDVNRVVSQMNYLS